jgi:putative membrane protein
MLINIGLSLAGNALGLLVANWVLDDMSMTWQAFLIAVAIFTVAMFILRPLVVKMSLKYAQALGGSSALIATFLALIITTLITSDMDINGAVTWLAATVIVWVVSMLGGLFLPWLLLRNSKYGRSPPAAAPPAASTWS